MSFLLDGKARRRGRIPARNVAPRSRIVQQKDTNNNMSFASGQIQIQRPQQQRVQQQRVVPHPQQVQRDDHQQQQQQKNQHAMQTAGISMEQVMEDLRVLEEQQRDSQRKLAQAKVLKQNRTDRQTLVETQLASLKYKNGEQRAQLTRCGDILSKSTREFESLKVDARANDDRLKATDNDLKKALMLTRLFQTYCRKIDGRLQLLRSKETACQRLESASREDLKIAEKSLAELQAKDQHLRQSIAQAHSQAQTVIDDTSKVRSENSGLAEDLRAANQMQASTKGRAESITAEIADLESRHEEDIKALEARRAEQRAEKEAILVGRKMKKDELAKKKLQLQELLKQVEAIRAAEGHEHQPTADGDAIPYLDVERIVRLNQEEEQKLVKATAEKDALSAKSNLQATEQANIKEECSVLAKESTELRLICEKEHQVELKRTAHNESFLGKVEKERQEVETLRVSLAELETTKTQEKQLLQAKLDEDSAVIATKEEELKALTFRLVENANSIEAADNELEKARSESTTKLMKAKEAAETAETSFNKVKLEVESVRNKEDPALHCEIQKIEKAQKMMVEETNTKVCRLLKGNPALQELVDDFEFDHFRGMEEQVQDALANFEQACDERKQAAKKERKTLVAEIREEKKRLVEQERQEQEAKDQEERGKKERRREDRRRKKAELAAAAETKRQEKEERKLVEQERKEQERSDRARKEKERKAAERQRRETERGEADRQAKEEEGELERQAKTPSVATLDLRAEGQTDTIDWGTPHQSGRGGDGDAFDETGFADTGFGNEDDSLNGNADGCLTQRPGLAVHTPSSEEGKARTKPALIEARNETEEPRKTKIRWGTSPEQHKVVVEKEPKKKVFGSSSSRSPLSSASNKAQSDRSGTSKSKELKETEKRRSSSSKPSSFSVSSKSSKTKSSKTSTALSTKPSKSSASGTNKKKHSVLVGDTERKPTKLSHPPATTKLAKPSASSRPPSSVLIKPNSTSRSSNGAKRIGTTSQSEKPVKRLKSSSKSVTSTFVRRVGSKKSTLSRKSSSSSKHGRSSLEKHTSSGASAGGAKRRRKSKGTIGKSKSKATGGMAPDFNFSF